MTDRPRGHSRDAHAAATRAIRWIAAVYLAVAGLLAAATHRAAASDVTTSLQTRPESTGFRETTRYAEAVDLLRRLDAQSDLLHLTHFGYSSEGRPLPLLIYGTAGDTTAERIRGGGKLRIYLQGNIHAGEVCGKEALLSLARDLATGRRREWAREAVLLIAPIYNPDGNERIAQGNRPHQNGPLGGMGERANAQGLDLNRDHVKLDSPEARSLARLYRVYDPHLAVDFHTTNGAHHAYHLTYSPPLHPNTHPALDRQLRRDMLPAVTERMAGDSGWLLYYYGIVPRAYSGRRDWYAEPGDEVGWYAYGYQPRYSSNYAGLRNRFGVLSEAYAYLSFEERIRVSRNFAEELVQYACQNADHLRSLTAEADATPVDGQDLALRATHRRSGEKVEILMGEVTAERHPDTGEEILRRRDAVVPVRIFEYGSFVAAESTRAPRAYCLPDSMTAAIDLLRAHGIRTEAAPAGTAVRAERFRIDSVKVADRAYEGHVGRTLFGQYEAVDLDLPPNCLLVPVAQPLGRLVFALLEPRSDDGLVAWGLIDSAAMASASFDRQLDGSVYYPILRLPGTR